MMTGPQKTAQYDALSKINHWTVAMLMIGMVVLGFYVFNFMPRGPDKGMLIGLHKSIGVLILVLGAWRVAYRLWQGFLPEVGTMPRWQGHLAKLIHFILLLSIVLMPVSGMIGSLFGGRDITVFGLFTIPSAPKTEWLSQLAYSVHETLALLLAAAVVLHIAGALKHHIIDKDSTLRRMLPRS